MIFERSHILAVEDEPGSLRRLAEILGADHDLTIATNADDALKLVANKPDLVLLDLYLGETRGIDVLISMKTDPELQDIPVLCVTSSTVTEDIEEAFRFGAVDYITKPYNAIILRSKVNTFLDLSRKTALLKAQAHTDALTGLGNRRQLEQQLPLCWQQAADIARPLSAIMVDLDNFKGVNDYYGHPVGDATIRYIATTLTECAADHTDYIYRMGGDEFLLLLPGMEYTQALALAENIRAAVEATSLDMVPTEANEGGLRISGIDITVSLGVASTMTASNVSPQRVIESADDALYQAKEAGRNCVRPRG
jgi:diguanylate cyclase (GGDEF)-like protein